MISEPGFYEMPAQAYHADPCVKPSLSSSLAAEIVTRSPAHARLSHPRLCDGNTATKESPSLSFGSVVHELLLGKGGGFSLWEGDSWRGNDAATFRELSISNGMTPIKRADFDRANALAESVRRQCASMGIGYVFEEGKSEQVAVWKSGDHYMRAMFDRWLPERNEIWDIKTTSSIAHPENLSREIVKWHYDIRSEFYLMGAEKLTGIPSIRGGLGFLFLFVEVEPPFCVVPCYLDQTFKTRGRKLAQEAIDLWARSMETGHWPGYVNGAVEIAAPGWVEFEIEETGITPSGERIV